MAEAPQGAQIVSWGHRGAIEDSGSSDAAERRPESMQGSGEQREPQFCCGNIPASADAMESLLLLQGSCFAVARGGGRGQPALLLRSSGNLVELVQTSSLRPQLCPGKKKKGCVCVSSPPEASQPGPRGF